MADDKKNLDLKNAEKIFSEAMERLESRFSREDMCFPKEIMWLGGAPGSGKGTNTPFILRERDITAEPIVMSDLLDTPEMQRLKDAGQFVGDAEVIEILLAELLKPQYESGVVVDGFPRTKVQVECVKLLYNRMIELRREFFDTVHGPKFRRPIFRITVLYVTEKVSVERQISRGQKIHQHNIEVEETGNGTVIPLRKTDIDPDLAKGRYDLFKEQTFDALESLRQHFFYHIVDANGPIDEVENNIAREFQYQSSLELGQDTHDTIRNIPVVGNLIQHARFKLVRRLDNYRNRHAELFARAVELIEDQIVPILRRHSCVGRAHARIEHPLLDQDLVVDMVIDILTERGYLTTVESIEREVPLRVDQATGAIICATRSFKLFEIGFHAPQIRRID